MAAEYRDHGRPVARFRSWSHCAEGRRPSWDLLRWDKSCGFHPAVQRCSRVERDDAESHV